MTTQPELFETRQVGNLCMFDMPQRRKRGEHDMHTNSMEAYEQIKPELNARAQSILTVFNLHGQLTDRQALRLLGMIDMNNVRPRITELIKSGHLCECGAEFDTVTGKTVRVCRATQKKG